MLEKKRVEELDIIKGVGMLMIAVYHLVYRAQDGIPDKIIRSLGWALIAVFFMLSGYFSNPDKGVLNNYKRRFLGLMFPAMMAELFLLGVGGIYCRFFHEYSTRDILHDAAVTFLRPEITTKISTEWGEGNTLFLNLSPVWYIWALGWTLILFYPIEKLVIGKSLKWLAMVLFLIGIQIPIYLYVDALPWSLKIVPVFTVFMLIGMKAREINLVNRLKDVSLGMTALYTVVFFAVHFILFLFGGTESYYISILGTRGWLDVPLVVLQLLVAFPAFFGLARLISQVRPLAKYLSWVGRYSLTFLLFHSFFGLIFSDLLNTYSKMGPNWYMEFLGLTVTPEVFWKSVAVFVLSVICTMPCAVFGDYLARKVFERRLRWRELRQRKREGK